MVDMFLFDFVQLVVKVTSMDKYFFFSSRCSGKSFITCSAVCSPNQREHSSVCVGGGVRRGVSYAPMHVFTKVILSCFEVKHCAISRPVETVISHQRE